MNSFQFLICLLLLSCGLSAAAQVAPDSSKQPFPVVFWGDDPLWHCHSCQFPVYKDGGMDGMMRAISKNLSFPPGLQTNGRIFVRFTIDTTGQVQNIIVKQPLYPAADSIAVWAVRLLGRFAPALDPRGRPMAVKFTVPITFSIE